MSGDGDAAAFARAGEWHRSFSDRQHRADLFGPNAIADPCVDSGIGFSARPTMTTTTYGCARQYGEYTRPATLGAREQSRAGTASFYVP